MDGHIRLNMMEHCMRFVTHRLASLSRSLAPSLSHTLAPHRLDLLPAHASKICVLLARRVLSEQQQQQNLASLPTPR